MAEGGMDERDPLIPHGEDHDDGDDDDGYGDHDDTLDFSHEHYSEHDDHRSPDVKEKAKRDTMQYLRGSGFLAAEDGVSYTTMDVRGETWNVVSLDGNNWYRVEIGQNAFGETDLGLTPFGMNRTPAPANLYEKFYGVQRGDAHEFLSSIFVDPKFSRFDYGWTRDDRLWVGLSRVNATKYFIDEDGNVTNEKGKKAKLPSTMKAALGETISKMTERVKRENEKSDQRIAELEGSLKVANEKKTNR